MQNMFTAVILPVFTTVSVKAGVVEFAPCSLVTCYYFSEDCIASILKV
jgi:hypothetical protein